MSSASRLEVLLSAAARDYLLSLPEREARTIAMYLLTFYKNATPAGSRALRALEREEHDRIWNAGKYEIAYRYFPDESRVEIGLIRRRK